MSRRLVDAESGAVARSRRSPGSRSQFGQATVKDPTELSNGLTKLNDRLASLEASGTPEVVEFDIICPYNSTVTLNHGFTGAIRWYVTGWKRKGNAGIVALSEVESGGSREGCLVLYSQVPGRAIIRVESAQNGVKADQTTRTLVSVGGGGATDIVFGSASFSTTATWTRLGARMVDMSLYPTVTSAVFKFTLENSLTSAVWYSQCRLFDLTNNVAVTGTTLDNSAEVDRSLTKEFASAALTVGSAAGNIRSDAPTLYAVQFQATGTIADTSTMRAIIGGARLVLS